MKMQALAQIPETKRAGEPIVRFSKVVKGPLQLSLKKIPDQHFGESDTLSFVWIFQLFAL